MADPPGDRRIRLLLVVASLQLAGAERQVAELITKLDPARYRTVLVTFDGEDTMLPDVLPFLAGHYRLRKRRRWDLGLARSIAAVIKRERIELVQSTLEFATVVAWLGNRLAPGDRPLVPAIHSTIQRDRKDAVLTHLVYAPLLRRLPIVVAVSTNQADYWADRYGLDRKRIRVIHNGIRIDDRDDGDGVGMRRGLGIPEGSPVIGVLARLRPEKRHEDVLAAVQQLTTSGRARDAQVVLVGEGPRREFLERRANELGLGDAVHFLGNRSDARAVLKAFDVSVLASDRVETFSLAVLEAMAAGKPVVATSVGGITEQVVDGSTGFVVQPRDVDALAAAIDRLLADPDLRAAMGAAARSRVVSEFSSERMSASWDDLLREVAASGSPA
jgi:glycosyltransferase involved in cell wall biosynthesis